MYTNRRLYIYFKCYCLESVETFKQQNESYQPQTFAWYTTVLQQIVNMPESESLFKCDMDISAG